MKALEKAAKDRGETAAQPSSAPAATVPGMAPIPRAPVAPPSAPAKLELSLEPVTDTPEPVKPAAPKTAAAPKAAEQARAAAVLQANAGAMPDLPPPRRFKPVVVVAAIAGIAVVGFGIYVYLQITNPGLFIRQAPPAPQPPQVQAPKPAPAAPAPIATDTIVAPAAPGAAAPAAGAAATAAAVTDTPPAARPAPAAPARAEAPRDSIKISTGNPEPQMDPRLTDAYAALQSGKLDTARQLYGDIVRSDPKNIQALLGAAATAMQQNGADEASRLYFRVLDLEPRNAYAQAGIVSLMGRADPAAAEAKLKQLIGREPLASLHFTLGNLYADQSRWAEAQQSYFQAHHLETGNPDYAYNLAVGLEHVGQTKLAVGFYRRAIELAQARGRAGFNLNQAQDRVRQLASKPE